VSEMVLTTADVKEVAELAVTVIPVLGLSYLVADTEKFNVSSLLKSRIIKRFAQVENPEIYDAIPPLLFCVAAIFGFGIGLVVVTSEIVQVWQLAVLFLTLGLCALIIIGQIILSIVVPALDNILVKHQHASKDGKLTSLGRIVFFIAALAAILTALGVLANLAYNIYQMTQVTIS